MECRLRCRRRQNLHTPSPCLSTPASLSVLWPAVTWLIKERSYLCLRPKRRQIRSVWLHFRTLKTLSGPSFPSKRSINKNAHVFPKGGGWRSSQFAISPVILDRKADRGQELGGSDCGNKIPPKPDLLVSCLMRQDQLLLPLPISTSTLLPPPPPPTTTPRWLIGEESSRL